jgi:hypothetical protein
MSEPLPTVDSVERHLTPCRSIRPTGSERDSLQATDREH